MPTPRADAKNVLTSMGVVLARMHDASITHGDLTTSNLMLRKTKDAQPSLVGSDWGVACPPPTHPAPLCALTFTLNRTLLLHSPVSSFIQVVTLIPSTTLLYTSTTLLYTSPTLKAQPYTSTTLHALPTKGDYRLRSRRHSVVRGRQSKLALALTGLDVHVCMCVCVCVCVYIGVCVCVRVWLVDESVADYILYNI